MVDQTEVGRTAVELLEGLRHELGLPKEIADALRVESPLLVSELRGAPSYWLVPLAAGDRLAGFFRMGLKGDLLSYGRFGQGRDLDSLPPLPYLSAEHAQRELSSAFGPGYRDMSAASLVHDGPLERIAWAATGTSAEGTRHRLFWSFGSFYSRSEQE